MKTRVVGVLAALGSWAIPESRQREIKAAASQYLEAATYASGDTTDILRRTFVMQAPLGDLPLDADGTHEVVIHPIDSIYCKPEHCRVPTERELDDWRFTARQVSTQFADDGLPLRIRISETDTRRLEDRLSAVACDSGYPIAGQFERAVFGADQLLIRDNHPRVRVHELGHALGLSHPHDVAPMGTLQHELAELICEGSPQGRGSVMHYDALCESAGYSLFDRDDETPDTFGSVDLMVLRKATTSAAAWNREVAGQCADALFGQVAATAGTRIAGFFVASLAARLVERSLAHAVLRAPVAGKARAACLEAASAIATLVSAAVLCSSLGGSARARAFVAAGAGCTLGLRTGALGQAVRALGDVIHTAGLYPALFGVTRDSAWGTPAVVASVAGGAVGNIVAAAIEGIVVRCVPPSGPVRSAMAARAGRIGVAPEPAAHAPAGSATPSAEARCETALRTLKAFDGALAAGIDRYVSHCCLVSWIYKLDQQQQDAAHDIEQALDDALAAAPMAPAAAGASAGEQRPHDAQQPHESEIEPLVLHP